MPQSVALQYLFYAYTAAFVLIFGFSFSTYRKTAALRKQLQRLQDEKSKRMEQ